MVRSLPKALVSAEVPFRIPPWIPETVDTGDTCLKLGEHHWYTSSQLGELCSYKVCFQLAHVIGVMLCLHEEKGVLRELGLPTPIHILHCAKWPIEKPWHLSCNKLVLSIPHLFSFAFPVLYGVLLVYEVCKHSSPPPPIQTTKVGYIHFPAVMAWPPTRPCFRQTLWLLFHPIICLDFLQILFGLPNSAVKGPVFLIKTLTLL